MSRVLHAPCSASLLALALAAAAVRPAGADPAADAAVHYKAAEDAMARAAWLDAAREYTAAYDLGHDPILLLKLGTAAANAGQCDAARAAIDGYLAEGNPSPEYRAMAEERAAGCVPAGAAGAVDPASTGGAPPTGGAGPTPGGHGTTPGAGDVVDDPDVMPSLGVGGPSFTDTGSSWKRSAGWIAAGTTFALVAVGSVLALSAEGSEEDLDALIGFRTSEGGSERPLRWDEIDDQYVDLVDEGARFDRLATITFTAAGITAAAAITFFVLDATTGHHEQGGLAIAPRLDRDGASVSLGWTF